jgi:hypothetical protein
MTDWYPWELMPIVSFVWWDDDDDATMLHAWWSYVVYPYGKS